MNIQDAIDKQIAYAKFLYYTKGSKPLVVDIAEIPEQWENFNDSKDLWKKVDYGEDIGLSGCMYRVHSFKFLNHVHLKSDEIITNITENTSFVVYTPAWFKEVKYGDCVFIPKGVEHICVWKNSGMLVNIVWHPPMLGWQGEFKGEKK